MAMNWINKNNKVTAEEVRNEVRPSGGWIYKQGKNTRDFSRECSCPAFFK
jgi:hypothetical protein